MRVSLSPSLYLFTIARFKREESRFFGLPVMGVHADGSQSLTFGLLACDPPRAVSGILTIDQLSKQHVTGGLAY